MTFTSAALGRWHRSGSLLALEVVPSVGPPAVPADIRDLIRKSAAELVRVPDDR
jgi:hypothetical protein